MSLGKAAYIPIWTRRREAITGHRLCAMDPEVAEPLPGYRCERNAPASARDYLDVDEWALRTSEEALRRAVGIGSPAMLVTPIHIASLANLASQIRILTLLSKLSPELGRYRVLMAAGVSPSYPRTYAIDALRMLRGRATNVALGISWREDDLPTLLKTQPAMLMVATPPREAPSDKIIAKMRSVVDAAHRARVAVTAEGDFGAELALGLIAVGVDSLCAPAIWPERDAPGPLTAWGAERLAAPRRAARGAPAH